MTNEEKKDYMRNYRMVNKEAIKAQKRLWVANNYTKHKKQHNKRNRKYKDANKDKIRECELKRKYNITALEYDRLLIKQNGVCAICYNPDLITHNRLAVDHNHLTGKVRGLLCFRCNTTLGQMQDNPTLLRNAAAYLESHVDYSNN